MHNNYFFLKRLVDELNRQLIGAELIECYSQHKYELILGLVLKNKEEFYLKADLRSSFSCLSVRDKFARAKQNTVNLFSELQTKRVKGLEMFKNERAFQIKFEGTYSLVFKLFGNRSSILFYNNDICISVFNKQNNEDEKRLLKEWNRSVEISELSYQDNLTSLEKCLPTLGKQLAGYVSEHSNNLSSLLSVVEQLGREIYIDDRESLPQLTLVPLDGCVAYDSPIEALNTFYRSYVRVYYFEQARAQVIRKITHQLKQLNKKRKKLKTHQEQLEQERPLNEVADVIMANLHIIKKGQERVKLFDFYLNEEKEFQLKRQLTPQKYCSQLYKKSKNRSKELDHVVNNIQFLDSEELRLVSEREQIEACKNAKELKPYQKLEQKREKVVNAPRFKQLEYQGYIIQVGRNAKNNDELTKSAHKEDLWLHAKDVSGSHVIIKHKSGSVFPRNVIENAASIAAYYSKRKTESLCPVIFTPRKYIRKVKGSPAGSVMVDKEEVILVPPKEKGFIG